MTHQRAFRLPPNKKPQESFTFSDICAGIGGMRLAFEALGGKCIFSSEWNEFCQKTYCENFGDTPHGDITKIKMRDIPKHDVLLAGFPCQPFSKGGLATRKKLGRKSGIQDKTQGTMFFTIAKIIETRKPKAVLLENVPQLERMNGGKTLQRILNKLEKTGYSVSYKTLSSESLVPQRRKRLYIVALKNKTEFHFPELPQLYPELRNILEKNADSKYTLSNNLWSWLQKHAKKHEKNGNGFGFRIADPKKTACTLSARYGKDGSEILIPQKCRNPRKLTPRECARLMGFPDSFKISVSDTQAYKQFGNSVVIPVVYMLGNQMLKTMRFDKVTNLQNKLMLHSLSK